MQNTNNTNINVGYADVFSIEEATQTNTVVKALGDSTNPLVTFWVKPDSPILKAIEVGSQVGYLREDKELPSVNDPRKLEMRTFYTYLPHKAVKRFLEGVANV